MKLSVWNWSKKFLSKPLTVLTGPKDLFPDNDVDYHTHFTFYSIYQITSLRSFVSCLNSVKWIFVALSNYCLIYLMINLSTLLCLIVGGWGTGGQQCELITSFKGVVTFSKSIYDKENNSKSKFCCSLMSHLAQY